MVTGLEDYTPAHRAELEELLHSPAWQTEIASGRVERVSRERLEPGRARNFVSTVVEQLLRFNRERVAGLIAQGCRDRERLLEQISRWPAGLAGEEPVVSFLGLNLTAKCDYDPRCLYCNQPYVESAVDIQGWKRIIEAVTPRQDGPGCYIYMTGGEPLTLGEDLWGEEGLIRFATERGARVNLNTNAATLTPEVALRLIHSGLGRLHVSLDSADAAVHDQLAGGRRFQQVLQGIYNVQLARDLVGSAYPLIHVNCVLTNQNFDRFPELFTFLLEKRKRAVQRADPFSQDLLPHLIPVGGAENANLRPSAAEFLKFYTDVWAEVGAIWDRYQQELGLAQEARAPLFGPFSNPFLRVEHRGSLADYVQAAAEGRYGRLALSRHCYVAPTQAALTPDGFQYRCGSHAVRRILPVGNIRERALLDTIRDGVEGLEKLPEEEYCYGCALATLYINQAVEARLAAEVDTLLGRKEA